MRILFAGIIGRYPFGGVTWCSLMYLLGLRALGHEVFYIEDTGECVYDPILNTRATDPIYGTTYIHNALEPYGLAWLEVDAYDPRALAYARSRSPIPICSGENLYTVRGFRPYLEAGAMDIASVDVIWNGFAQSRKIADLAETYEVSCAPHNYYSHLATFIAAQWCAVIPNVRMLEVDVDDVPWREELTSTVPEIQNGEIVVPGGPGWGCDVDEGVLAALPAS